MLAVIIKEIKGFFRAGSQLFFCIFFPSLMVFLLGNLLENLDISDYEIGKITLGYYSEDGSDLAEEYFKDLEEQDILTLKHFDSMEKAEAEVKAGKLSACAVTKENNIMLLTGDDGIKNRSLEAMTKGFLYMNQTYTACAANTDDPLALTQLQPSDQEYTITKGLGIERSMIDYYAVAMVVMTVFMCSMIAGGECFVSKYRDNTMYRLYISPISRAKLFFAKILGAFPMTIIQIAVIMVVSIVFFGAHYADGTVNNLLLFLMLFTASLAALSVGVFAGLFFKKISPGAVFQPLAWIMLFFSGSFSKEIYIEGFTNICPPYIIQQAAFELTLFGNKEAAVKVTAVSAAIFIALMMLGVLKFSRKEGV